MIYNPNPYLLLIKSQCLYIQHGSTPQKGTKKWHIGLSEGHVYPQLLVEVWWNWEYTTRYIGLQTLSRRHIALGSPQLISNGHLSVAGNNHWPGRGSQDIILLENRHIAVKTRGSQKHGDNVHIWTYVEHVEHMDHCKYLDTWCKGFKATIVRPNMGPTKNTVQF